MFTSNELMSHADRLEKFAQRLTRNSADASDLVQSTMLRALEKKHMFEDGTNLFGWLSKIMYNMFASQYKRKSKFETQYDPEPYIQSQSVSANHEAEMELQNVDIAMSRLSKEHRIVLEMVCVKGMKYQEVSSLLDIPVGTVRSRLSRAREALQDAIQSTANVSHLQQHRRSKSRTAIQEYCLAA